MKVLHVTQNYYPSQGGTQYQIKKISEFLHERYNDEVTVFTTDSMLGPEKKIYKKIKVKEEVIDGVLVRRFSFFKSHKPFIRFSSKISYKLFKKPIKGVLKNLQTGPISFNMFREMATANADVICASSLNYLFSDYARWRKHTSKPKPFVLYGAAHITPEAEISTESLKRIAAADYYIANTSFEKEYLERCGIDAYKIKVVGAATDIYKYANVLSGNCSIRSKHNFSPKDIIITYIGRQETLKGIPLLLEAFETLNIEMKNIRLMIAGAKGSYSNSLHHHASSNKSITVLDNISDIEKAEILSITNILVLPSKEESFGLVFLEAWSFKKPVVGVNIGAVASVVTHDVNGFLFDIDSSESLIAYLRLLISDEQLRNKLGEAGFEKVMKNYTWEIIGEKFREVYKAAIEKYNKQSLIKRIS